jgi:hypothetical protein
VEELSMTRKTSKRHLILSVNLSRWLRNRSLQTYLALRRQKVKVGPLKPVVDGDLEIFACMPDVLEEKIH